MQLLLPQPLRFARGVRLAREEDLPRPREEALARLATAAITTGYFRRSPGESGFSDYFEINAHAEDIWGLFSTLSQAILPEVAAPLVAFKDDEPVFGPYTEREMAIQAFQSHASRLVQDGYIEFGIVYGHAGVTEEVLVKSYKYLCVWTNHPEAVEAVLAHFGIPSQPSLQFIDEFPCVTESLKDESQGAQEIIEAVKAKFQTLPNR